MSSNRPVARKPDGKARERVRESSAGALPSGCRLSDEPIVRGVKILGQISKKGRVYTREAIARAVSERVYEGKPVYIDHRSPSEMSAPRPFLSKFGRVVNVRQCPTSGDMLGDLRYNPRHAAAETFRGWVEHDPGEVGFSHDATVFFQESTTGLREGIEITEVESIDLVASPATTQGLFESTDSMDPLMTEGGESYEAQLGKLIAGIVTDSALSMDQKRKKVLLALKLSETEETETPPEETTEEEVETTESEDTEDEGDKVEEAIGRIRKEVGEIVTEAVTRLTAAAGGKAPISLPPARKAGKALTAEELLAALPSLS